MHKLLIRYGEISLKGHNRERFIDALVSRLHEKLRNFSGILIKKLPGRIFLDYREQDEAEVFEKIKKTFGIVSFSPVDEVELSLEAASEAAVSQAGNLISRGLKTFKIEARRSNKGFYLKSPEISGEVGAAVLKAYPELKVDVHNPDFTIEVEVRHKIYVYSEVIKCLGGMPYGTSGRGLVLLSGGIDSPVAAYMMAKRGLYIEAVHFHSYPYTSERAKDKVLRLAEILSSYTGDLKVHMVNIAKLQEIIRDKLPSDEMTVHSRRFMMRIASEIARRNSLNALVTGESLAQVASQTLEGMTVIEDASDFIIFKPLIAYDKADTVLISKKIDCYETSILPFEDCCTVFLPPQVVTRPKLDKIKKSESRIDVDAMLKSAMETVETVTVSELGTKQLNELI